MTNGGKFAWGLVIAAAILHFDFWLWDSTELMFGFLPVGLAYQAGISIVAAIAWFLVVRLDWPEHIEEWADETPDDAGRGTPGNGAPGSGANGGAH